MSYEVVRGVGLTGGGETPGVERMPWGDETRGVVAEGDRVLGGDGPGRGGYEKSQSTHAASVAGTENGTIQEYRKPGLAALTGDYTIGTVEESSGGDQTNRRMPDATNARTYHGESR